MAKQRKRKARAKAKAVEAWGVFNEKGALCRYYGAYGCMPAAFLKESAAREALETSEETIRRVRIVEAE